MRRVASRLREPDRRRGPVPHLAALHLVALWALAVAQPIFEAVGSQPSFLVAHRATGADVLALVVIVSFAVPSVWALLTWGAGRFSPAAGTALQLQGVGVCVGLLTMLAAKQAELPGVVAWSLSLLAAFVGAAAYWRWPGIRTFCSFLGVAAAAVPVLFLAQGPVAKLAFGGVDVDLAEGARRDLPVVLLIFDELPLTTLLTPNGEINGERFPAFAELASTSHWLRNATTVADYTQYAIPPILTGAYPEQGAVLDAADYPHSLFTLLAGSHDVRAVELVSRLCPTEVCGAGPRLPFRRRLTAMLSDTWVIYLNFALPEDLAALARVPEITSDWRGFRRQEFQPADSNGKRPMLGFYPPNFFKESFSRFLDEIAGEPKRRFYYFHSVVPHLPWRYNPSGAEYGPLDDVSRPRQRVSRWGANPWWVLQGQQRHLLQVVYADRLLGRIVERLRDVGLWDEALVIVTSDHGVSFRPGDFRRRLTPTNAPEVLPIPLFVKVPGQSAGTVDDRNAQSIDILPTVAAVADAPIPDSWSIDGHDLLSSEVRQPDQKMAIGTKDDRAYRFEQTWPGALDSARRLERNFGRDLDGLYRLGPRPELLGRPSADLGASPSRWRFELEDGYAFRRVVRDGRFLPTRVLGSLWFGEEGPQEAGDRVPSALEVAVSINGVVRASTWAIATDRHGWRLSAMLPETALTDGANEVRIHVAGPTGWTAASVTGGTPWSLGARDGSEILLAPDGREIAIQDGALAGAVWSTRIGVEGWAADLDRQRRARSVVGLAGGELVFETDDWLPNRKLSQAAGVEALRHTAFQAVASQSLTADPRTTDLRIFAIGDGVASELRWIRSP
ncbi:MAG: sulfatase-like hydrolase/transferase [Acidobacteriota bacterium]